jgi:hypothetical protein
LGAVRGTEGGLGGGLVAMLSILGFSSAHCACKGNWCYLHHIQAQKAKIASRWKAELAISGWQAARCLNDFTYCRS